MLSLKEEITRRRTFAIISHPDAGKTTITEKILFQGGVIREAGEVKGKAGRKAATSDWMAMEQQRGVSITSSVMQFDFQGLRVNLLDTPGHKDFGEDTYRTLIAADSAAMLIDAAKGVEARTRSLFEVCQLRKIPIFTFANKMDRDGKDPLELIDDVESTLGLRCFPVTWPIGMGDRFYGLYHRLEKKVYVFKKGIEEPESFEVADFRDPQIDELGEAEVIEKFREDLELLEGALEPFDEKAFLRGEVSPMSFGSAKFNWGVDLFMELFGQQAPGPSVRGGEDKGVDPLNKNFSGFVFKIQANMDRRHRDRIAFIRICSGKFQRGMKVKHQRLGRELRLAYASQFFAQDRETADEAYAGDIVGVTDTGHLRIGDSLSSGPKVSFEPLPRFSPEVFCRLSIKDPLKRRQMQKALYELSEEGAIQLFFDPLVGMQDPVIGAVGELQLDVLMFRLNDEYQLEVKMNREPFGVARWPRLENGTPVENLSGGVKIYNDLNEQPVILLNQEWDLKWLKKENPKVEFQITGPI